MSAQLRKVALRRSPGKQCTVDAGSIDLVQVGDLDALQKLHAQHLPRHRMASHGIALSSSDTNEGGEGPHLRPRLVLFLLL